MSTSQRIFVTGVSGYIGGHIVVRIMEQHPEWNIAVLVRNEAQKEIVLKRWPHMEIVIGGLDDTKLMISEASRSDVVLQTASADHLSGVQALIQGLSLRKPTPGYFIHVSGTGILNDVPNGFGQPSPKVYNDIADLAEISSFPLENHIHRDVDIAIFEAQKQLGVHTAIISPPTIHGVGQGPIKTRSLQVPFLIEAILKRGKGFQVLEGQNIWNQLHIDDVASAFILLVEEALQPNGGKAQWDDDGYYFVEDGEFKWKDISTALTKIIHDQGLINSGEVDQLSVVDASALHPWAPLLWGGNCRAISDRLRQLGWKAAGPSILESLPAMVAEEAKTLGKQSSKTTFDK